jgi:hypothetical protein
MAKYVKGYKRSKDVQRKISAALIGKPDTTPGMKYSDEHRRNISAGLVGRPSPMLGKKLSEETKRRISVANAGNNHPMFGKKLSKETIKKLSIRMIGNKNPRFGKLGTMLGKRHPKETLVKISGCNGSNWKGGVSCEPYCDAWADWEYKNDIKERDGNKCQNPDCRQNCIGLPLIIHHIDYIKKNCPPQNLITLCCSCNGRANYNREDWTKFYQEIMTEKYGYGY